MRRTPEQNQTNALLRAQFLANLAKQEEPMEQRMLRLEARLDALGEREINALAEKTKSPSQREDKEQEEIMEEMGKRMENLESIVRDQRERVESMVRARAKVITNLESRIARLENQVRAQLDPLGGLR